MRIAKLVIVVVFFAAVLTVPATAPGKQKEKKNKGPEPKIVLDESTSMQKIGINDAHVIKFKVVDGTLINAGIAPYLKSLKIGENIYPVNSLNFGQNGNKEGYIVVPSGIALGMKHEVTIEIYVNDGSAKTDKKMVDFKKEVAVYNYPKLVR